ncbi:MAG TPA: tripartite tricarboxylate transporter TctB family protein [Burkholderiales bacterium]|nr:tripartite tricarboxylate transporter TctB family protein [Burkholderiales bacterium]
MKSDTVQGAFWIAVGAAIFYASWSMDRLVNLGVKPFSAPGLLPGILGIFIVLLGVAMLVRGRKELLETVEWRRVLLPLGICLGFAAGLVGHGLPFWLAAWVFVAVMIWTLQYRERKAKGELRRLGAVAVSVGLGAGLAIALVFQELFLIRLP